MLALIQLLAVSVGYSKAFAYAPSYTYWSVDTKINEKRVGLVGSNGEVLFTASYTNSRNTHKDLILIGAPLQPEYSKEFEYSSLELINEFRPELILCSADASSPSLHERSKKSFFRRVFSWFSRRLGSNQDDPPSNRKQQRYHGRIQQMSAKLHTACPQATHSGESPRLKDILKHVILSQTSNDTLRDGFTELIGDLDLTTPITSSEMADQILHVLKSPARWKRIQTSLEDMRTYAYAKAEEARAEYLLHALERHPDISRIVLLVIHAFFHVCTEYSLHTSCR